MSPNLQVFNFIALQAGDLDPGRREQEEIGEALAAHLRSAGCDWYVPDKLELLEGGGVLGKRLLDREAIVSILAPRWLAWFVGDERADMWLSRSLRAPDPVADVKPRWAELEGSGRGVAPRSRLRTLAAYAVQEQLSIIEEELFELKELPAAERAASPGAGARLEAWRETVTALAEPVTQIGVGSIRRQHEEVSASIDELAKTLQG
jgi:hypothetical protein